jgi:hypothetical protein
MPASAGRPCYRLVPAPVRIRAPSPSCRRQSVRWVTPSLLRRLRRTRVHCVTLPRRSGPACWRARPPTIDYRDDVFEIATVASDLAGFEGLSSQRCRSNFRPSLAQPQHGTDRGPLGRSRRGEGGDVLPTPPLSMTGRDADAVFNRLEQSRVGERMRVALAVLDFRHTSLSGGGTPPGKVTWRRRSISVPRTRGGKDDPPLAACGATAPAGGDVARQRRPSLDRRPARAVDRAASTSGSQRSHA